MSFSFPFLFLASAPKSIYIAQYCSTLHTTNIHNLQLTEHGANPWHTRCCNPYTILHSYGHCFSSETGRQLQDRGSQKTN